MFHRQKRRGSAKRALKLRLFQAVSAGGGAARLKRNAIVSESGRTLFRARIFDRHSERSRGISLVSNLITIATSACEIPRLRSE
ncbi:hypothetical protein Hsw_1363 [Hymenobacter swuensis DY53]|uniref:Uncharacterized protein n=1 Tax=Hymenobacter swuensis DY53 TaxID=1227739 RepID=W8EWN3_9BACT|nr:hypothetical protein Hsw_1363 [Hymenobacter swuensis DY53]